jgi:hypothetical protein
MQLLQEVISRKEAIERGLKRYHGNCAKHGFVERYAACGKCLDCSREQVRNWSSEYVTWKSMIQRCTNPNHLKYKNYGARGIEVYCPWRESFECFLQHIGPRPSSQHSIDRKNNDYGYFPGNVKWSTAKEQADDRRKPSAKAVKPEQILAIAA